MKIDDPLDVTPKAPPGMETNEETGAVELRVEAASAAVIVTFPNVENQPFSRRPYYAHDWLRTVDRVARRYGGRVDMFGNEITVTARFTSSGAARQFAQDLSKHHHVPVKAIEARELHASAYPAEESAKYHSRETSGSGEGGSVSTPFDGTGNSVDWADVGEMIGNESLMYQSASSAMCTCGHSLDEHTPGPSFDCKNCDSERCFGFEATAAKKIKTDADSEPMDEYEFAGLPLVIENKKGSVRTWTDSDGTEGETPMNFDYGFIEGVKGSDGDEVDVYVGPNEKAEWVYVIHQNKKPNFTDYDEDKVMLGFDSADEAKKAYVKQYDDERFYGGMSEMRLEDFKEKLKMSDAGKITHAQLELDALLKSSENTFDTWLRTAGQPEAFNENGTDDTKASPETKALTDEKKPRVTKSAVRAKIAAAFNGIKAGKLSEGTEAALQPYFVKYVEARSEEALAYVKRELRSFVDARDLATVLQQPMAVEAIKDRFWNEFVVEKVAEGLDVPRDAADLPRAIIKRVEIELDEKAEHRTLDQSEQETFDLLHVEDENRDDVVEAVYLPGVHPENHPDRKPPRSQKKPAPAPAQEDDFMELDSSDLEEVAASRKKASPDPMPEDSDADFDDWLSSVQGGVGDEGGEMDAGVQQSPVQDMGAVPAPGAGQGGPPAMGSPEYGQGVDAFWSEHPDAHTFNFDEPDQDQQDPLTAMYAPMHILPQKAASADLPDDLFEKESSYSAGEYNISAISEENLAESRPRLLTDRVALVRMAVTAFQKATSKVRGRYTFESTSLARIDAQKVATIDGTLVEGMLTWNCKVAGHAHRRKAMIEIRMPVIAGEPQTEVSLFTVAGKELPFSVESLDQLFHVGPDTKMKPNARISPIVNSQRYER